MREQIEKRDKPGLGDVRQSQAFDSFCVDPSDRVRVRREVLATGDYYKVKAAIYFTTEAIAKLERWREAPEIASEFRDVFVKGPTKQPGFIYIENPDQPGSVAPCMVHRKDWKMMADAKVRPRVIRVERIQDKEGVSWAHENMSVRAGA